MVSTSILSITVDGQWPQMQGLMMDDEWTWWDGVNAYSRCNLSCLSFFLYLSDCDEGRFYEVWCLGMQVLLKKMLTSTVKNQQCHFS